MADNARERRERLRAEQGQEVLSLLRRDGASLSPAAIAKATGIKPNYLHRVLSGLEAAGEIEKSGREYSLSTVHTYDPTDADDLFELQGDGSIDCRACGVTVAYRFELEDSPETTQETLRGHAETERATQGRIGRTSCRENWEVTHA